MPSSIESAVTYGNLGLGKERDIPGGLSLSPRELEILELKAMGLINKEIAWKLGISPDTVKNFLSSALRKSGTNTVGTVLALIKSGRINREKLLDGIDCERYKYLSVIQIQLIQHILVPSTFEQTSSQMAYDMGISEQTFKNHCGGIYRTLEISPSVLRLRVFMYLAPANR